MNFAAATGHRLGRATPCLRDTPQRKLMGTTGRRSTYRRRNAVQANPATSVLPRDPEADAVFRRLWQGDYSFRAVGCALALALIGKGFSDFFEDEQCPADDGQQHGAHGDELRHSFAGLGEGPIDGDRHRPSP